MTKPIRDLAASVRQRLANAAKERHRPAAEVLQYFAMERFLYRLAQSPHRDRFILKGAMMLVAWRAPSAPCIKDFARFEAPQNTGFFCHPLGAWHGRR